MIQQTLVSNMRVTDDRGRQCGKELIVNPRDGDPLLPNLHCVLGVQHRDGLDGQWP